MGEEPPDGSLLLTTPLLTKSRWTDPSRADPTSMGTKWHLNSSQMSVLKALCFSLQFLPCCSLKSGEKPRNWTIPFTFKFQRQKLNQWNTIQKVKIITYFSVQSLTPSGLVDGSTILSKWDQGREANAGLGIHKCKCHLDVCKEVMFKDHAITPRSGIWQEVSLGSTTCSLQTAF